jgi:DUF917 family protein
MVAVIGTMRKGKVCSIRMGTQRNQRTGSVKIKGIEQIIKTPQGE